MNELVFTVTQEGDGGFVAEALGESIFTQADIVGRAPPQRARSGHGILF